MAKIRRRHPRNEPGITKLSVQGYKSLCQKQSIDIRPLTVIAGVNSAGKSSIIQPLLLLKQTLESPYDPGPLALHGPNVSIINIEQVISKGTPANASRSFTVGITIGDRETTFKFGKRGNDIRILEMSGLFLPDQQAPATISEDLSREELRERMPDFFLRFNDIIKDFSRKKEPEFIVTRDRFILAPSLKIDEFDGQYLNFSPLSATLKHHISAIIHLPALRGNPRRTYRTTAVEDKYPGTFESYTAGIIAAWQNRKATDKLRALKKDLEELGLTWKVEARQLDDTQVELLVGRLPHATRGGARDLVNIADVGFGVSQTLPVIVALLAAGKGQTVYLEQPEIHLHPRAQVAFAQLVKRAISRGVQIIVETHSALFIRAVQTLVALGQVNGDDVALHWFTRDSKSGYTSVASASLDEHGSFGDWPEDFDEVILDVEAGYLDAAARGAD